MAGPGPPVARPVVAPPPSADEGEEFIEALAVTLSDTVTELSLHLFRRGGFDESVPTHANQVVNEMSWKVQAHVAEGADPCHDVKVDRIHQSPVEIEHHGGGCCRAGHHHSLVIWPSLWAKRA